MTAQEARDRQLARKIASEYGLDPDLFERQIEVESGFQRTIGSSAGARDIAQFMPGTAAAWGVTLGDNNPEDDLRGAARYMRYYLRKFGSYRDALIAYNAGPGKVGKSLPQETRDYIDKILGSGGGSLNPSPLADSPVRGPATSPTSSPAATGNASGATKLLLTITLVGAGTAAALAGAARMVGVRSPLAGAGA